jgi:PPOX class probable F420-dependent enzyme
MDWTFSSAMTKKTTLISPAVRTKLDTARVARLATLDVQQSPHLVPICFALNGNVFYSAIDRKPKRVAPKRLARLKNIKKTPQVALLVDHYDENWTRLWYVLVRGEAELVSDPAERKRALQSLRAKYQQYGPEMLPEDAPLLRITPLRITAWGNIYIRKCV